MKITARSIAYGGEGVGLTEQGKVCFVRGLLPGETAEVEITEDKKRFARGEIEKLLSTVPERIPPACPYSDDCPGCAFQHCTYETELAWKQRQFEYFLRDFPGERLPIFPSPARLGWRNRIKFHCEGGKYGYRGRDNTTLVPVERCLLAVPAIDEFLTHAPAPADGPLFLRSCADRTGIIGEQEDALLTEELPPWGNFKVPASGFFQTNLPVASELVSLVTAELEKRHVRTLLELFCGVGVFSIAAAKVMPGLHSFGVELSRPAVAAAGLNAKAAGVEKRCSFQASDALKFPKGRPDAVLLDPPRTGAAPKLLSKLLDCAPELILYVSCAPDTLRRDLKILEAKYDVVSSGALDMFPCTAHFETFTVLTLSKSLS